MLNKVVELTYIVTRKESFDMSKQEDLIEITIKPVQKRFYSSDSNYGIYTVYLAHESDNLDLIKYDEYNREVILVGGMPELEYGSTYIAMVSEKKHPKFGLQYEAKTIYQKPLSTRAEQIIFLKTLLTEKQVDALLEAYPTENIVELIKGNQVDVELVKGIGEKSLKKIEIKIIENEKYQKAIIELTGKFNIPYNAVVRMSKQYGSPELLLEKVNKNPYILTELNGFGFKKVDEVALSMGIDKDSPQRITACLQYVIKDQAENAGHVWIKTNKAISEAVKLLGVKIAVVQSLLDLIVVDESNDINIVDGMIFVDKNFKYELGIATHLERLLDNKPVVSFDFDLDEAVCKVEEKQGFKFTEEQVRAIRYGIENNIVVVNGKAGTGKTSVIKGIIEVLQMHHATLKDVLPLEYATCALSGKASQRIQESTGLNSSTIHRLLAFNPNLGWQFNEDNPLGQDVIVLDEASMVNSQLFYFLVRAIKSGAKLIITGDTAQLEPIGVGNVLVDILTNGVIPSVELTIVHRQAQKSGILSNANLVRDGVKFVDSNDYSSARLGELKDLYMYPAKGKDKVISTVLQIARKYSQDIMDFQILTPMKSRGDLSTQALNKELQIIFNNDPSNIDEQRKIERKNNTLLEGDKVIINGNNYDKGVFNGTMGIIEYIDKNGDGEIIIDFEGVGRITFKKDELGQIDLGYAITTHKSQGSQWKFVVLAFDYSSFVLLNRQLVYTGMTRASQALFFPVELKALQHAIDTDKSSKRNTFLPLLLDKDETLMEFAKTFKTNSHDEESSL